MSLAGGCAHTALICGNCRQEQFNAESLMRQRDALATALRTVQLRLSDSDPIGIGARLLLIQGAENALALLEAK